jgi:hypothetical protein
MIVNKPMASHHPYRGPTPPVATKKTRICTAIWLSIFCCFGTALASAQSSDPLAAAQEGFDHPIKYAIYSPAWHLSTNAGLRVVAQNQSETPVELRSIVFRDEIGNVGDAELSLNLLIEPGKWAELQLPFKDILAGNESKTPVPSAFISVCAQSEPRGSIRKITANRLITNG